MSENPYAAPSAGATGLPSDSQGSYHYRSPKMLMYLASISIGVQVFLGILIQVVSMVELLFFYDESFTVPESAEFTDEELMFTALYAGLGLIGLVLVVTSAVFFCMWIYRANVNVRAMGAQGMKITPGWSAGWFFVPIANLFMPFRAMSEIYRASEPKVDAHSWQVVSTPAMISWWWGFWIVGRFIASAETRLGLNGDLGMEEMSIWMGLVSCGFEVAAGLLVISIVRQTTKNQELKFQARSDTASQGMPMPAGNVPPLVYNPLPSSSEPVAASVVPKTAKCLWCDKQVVPKNNMCPECQRPMM